MAKSRSRPRRRRAVAALTSAAQHVYGSALEPSDVARLGEGGSRITWAGRVTPQTAPPQSWVVQFPGADASPDDLQRYATSFDLLTHFETLDLPFRVPQPVARVHVEEATVAVVSWCRGTPIDMRGRLTRPADAARTLGKLSAQVHGLSTDAMPCPQATHTTCSAHARHALAPLRAMDVPFATDAAAWCADHLPSDDRAATVVHGDLVGQNVLEVYDGGPPALIDWEYAGTGDPAADLALITRGNRKLFGVEWGTDTLLEIYNHHADQPVTREALYVYELALVASEVSSFVAQYPTSADSEMGRLRNLFRRAAEPRKKTG